MSLVDKLFWRPRGRAWHCFKRLHQADRVGNERYISLCHRETMPRSGGQSLARPPITLRCGRCDGLEAQRAGKEESIDCTNDDWESFIIRIDK